MKKSQEISLASPEYRQFIEALKARVTAAHISAAKAVRRLPQRGYVCQPRVAA
jgi:hypothetical protein